MHERIIIDPNICHGKPVIKGTRVLLSNILSSLAAGESIDEIVAEYSNISKDDIYEALSFSSEFLTIETFNYEEKVS